MDREGFIMVEKSNIVSYSFDENGLERIRNTPKGVNWPVVYLIHNEDAIYIGETTSAATRMHQHLKNSEKNSLEIVEIIFDGEYNKSVVLDYEQKLIKYCSADIRFRKILNKNKGQQAAHDYFNRRYYRNQFKDLWKQLQKKGLAEKSLKVIENENIFKYSPYNALSVEQNEVSVCIINDILNTFETDNTGVSLVNGCAGTGKTVLAISLINSFINAVNIDDELLDGEAREFDDIDEGKRSALLRLKNYILKERGGKLFKIGFVMPMSGIRETIKKVFKECGNGLERRMVIAPCDVVKDDYDIIFVDESHRLSKRCNITNYKSFDDTSQKLNLDSERTNQLEWILKSAKHVVLFYDEYQSVKSSDISYDEYQNSLNKYAKNVVRHQLETQMRCLGGETYIEYVKAIMECRRKKFETMENYDFLLFDDVNMMIENIRRKDDQIGLCKTAAGYSWKWTTRPSKRPKDNMECYDMLVRTGAFDIEIEGYKYIWNLTDKGWATRRDSHCTIGCIHTVQGYDMNYVGVIFGEEIDYNYETNSLEINLDKYMDKKVKQNTDKNHLKQLILNTYTTILTRGIHGCYVYACNPNMREYLKQFVSRANSVTAGGDYNGNEDN